VRPAGLEPARGVAGSAPRTSGPVLAIVTLIGVLISKSRYDTFVTRVK